MGNSLWWGEGSTKVLGEQVAVIFKWEMVAGPGNGSVHGEK